MVLISIHFYPTIFLFKLNFSYMKKILHSQSKISLLSPFIIGSKLTFTGCCDCRLPYSAMFIVTSTTIYTLYKAQTMCKTRFGSQGVILDGEGLESTFDP